MKTNSTKIEAGGLFEEAIITLDTNFYESSAVKIIRKGNGEKIKSILVDGKKHKGFFISHQRLTSAKEVVTSTE